MADDDFDIDSLAAYLHVSPGEVTRLVERGKVPGRKVAGQWRFSAAEIHNWLESRIGLSDSDELEQLENVLRPREQAGEPHGVWLAELLPLEAVSAPLPARTRGAVISEMTSLAAKTGWLWDPEKMADAVRQRESLHSTALDNGVALLHPRRPMAGILGQAFLAMGITSNGIPFGGERMTDVFFLICSVEDRGHLHALARLSRLVSNGELLATLRAAGSPHEARAAVVDAEIRLVAPQAAS